jgi:hypothetical protein
LRLLYWRIRFIQSDCSLISRVWLKTLNLALVGGTPHYVSCFMFSICCLPVKFGEAFFYAIPELTHPLGLLIQSHYGQCDVLSLGVE